MYGPLRGPKRREPFPTRPLQPAGAPLPRTEQLVADRSSVPRRSRRSMAIARAQVKVQSTGPARFLVTLSASRGSISPPRLEPRPAGARIPPSVSEADHLTYRMPDLNGGGAALSLVRGANGPEKKVRRPPMAPLAEPTWSGSRKTTNRPLLDDVRLVVVARNRDGEPIPICRRGAKPQESLFCNVARPVSANLCSVLISLSGPGRPARWQPAPADHTVARLEPRVRRPALLRSGSRAPVSPFAGRLRATEPARRGGRNVHSRIINVRPCVKQKPPSHI